MIIPGFRLFYILWSTFDCYGRQCVKQEVNANDVLMAHPFFTGSFNNNRLTDLAFLKFVDHPGRFFL